MPQSLLETNLSSFKYPHYKIEVSYDHDKTLLVGKMQVRFAYKEYPYGELLFSLPGNRFLYPDNRGIRKHKIVPVFSSNRFQDNLEDPDSPIGFSYGNLKIISVNSLDPLSLLADKALNFELEENPYLEVGYSISKGLLRISLPKNLPDANGYPGEKIIQLKFSTKFPKNTKEGIVKGILMASNWHPKLLRWKGSQDSKENGWVIRETISPALFEVQIKSIQDGTLITTPGHFKLKAGQQIKLPKIKKPLKEFPIIFSNLYQKYDTKNSYSLPTNFGTQVISLYLKNHDRRAGLLHNWTLSFLEYMWLQFKLKSPWEIIHIVAVEAEYEQVHVINNLVLVPIPNYIRSEFMDRQAFGFLTRSLAKLWFGESVWNSEELHQWLNLGLPAFIGLRFYQNKFGVDAGIFDMFDWMNPRYRDHFFESMVNSISPKLTYPIISSFERNPASNKFLQTLTYKSAMVFSMLEYLVGPVVFKNGLHHFFKYNQKKMVTIKDLQKSFEKFNYPTHRNTNLPDKAPYNANGDGSLEWFFIQWFKTVQTMDYSFDDSTTFMLPDGKYKTEITIKKIGSAKMPIVVALITKDGKEIRRMSPGLQIKEKLSFITDSYPDQVSLDPEEKLLEDSKTNNHSFKFFRIRFGFDWKKQREQLVLLVPGLANNAFDGNSFGVGIRYRADDYRIYAIPGYGTKNHRGLYLFNFDRDNIGIHGLQAGFSLSEYGGVRSQGIRSTFEPSQNPGDLKYKFESSFSRETLFSARNNSYDSGIIERGKTNSLMLKHSGSFSPKNFYEFQWDIWNEQPALSFNSDFSYVRGQGTLIQILHVGHRKLFQLGITHATTSGDTPLQKKFQLGGPSILRGYPQQTSLSEEHLLASRLDYKFPVISSPLWGFVSAFKIQGSAFYDQGTVWSHGSSFEKAILRKNAGMGIEWTIDTASLIQVPLKIEVAFPIDDEEYKKPQFILLGVITGS